jgi:PhnB protein
MAGMTDKMMPAGYHSLTPYIAVRGAAAAIDFYQRVFGARQLQRIDGDGGAVLHALLEIGDSRLFVSDEMPSYGFHAPEGSGHTGSIMIYVDDVDAVYARAVEAGATTLAGLHDFVSGDRMAGVVDPFGHRWALATHIEDVPDDEVERRVREMMAVAS